MRDTFIPLLQFFVTTGEVTGRKKCQKIIHILQECGVDFGFDFKLALYGAYSSGLQCQLETFVEENYIKEQTTTSGISNYRTSQFVPNKRSKQILEILGQESDPAWSELAKQLNEHPTRKLEAASTILFLRRNGTSESELHTKLKALKPHLEDVFQDAFQLANQLEESQIHR